MAAERRRKVILGAVTVALVLMLMGTGLWALQRRLIYFPDGSAPDPAVLPGGWETVTYATADGLTLQAWYRPAGDGKPIVIVFSGNAGNRADRVDLGVRLAAGGLGVLLTDYRGYGGNPGHPTQTGLARDARAAAAFVKAQASESPLVYFGESLGAAVAVELASAEPPAVLVLRSPFTSMAAVGKEHYPWLPISALLKDRYPSLERISSTNIPTLVIAGDADSIIPVEQSRELYEAAPGEKRFLVIPGADHNDAALVHGREMIDAVTAFVADNTGE